MQSTELIDTEDELQFYQDIRTILDDAKNKTYEAANNIMTYAYWHVGKMIRFSNKKQRKTRSTTNRKKRWNDYFFA